MSNTSDVSKDQNALMMQLALDGQRASSRAGLALGIATFAGMTAILSAGVALWLVATTGQPQPIPVAQAPAVQQNQPAPAPQNTAQLPAPVLPQQNVAQAPAPAPAPTQPLAQAGNPQSQVFLAAGADGTMYAHDVGFNTWFQFDAAGVPQPITSAQVPPEAQTEITRQAQAGQNDIGVDTQAASQLADAAQIDAQTTDSRFPLFNELLSDTGTAQAILAALDGTPFIEVEGEANGQPVYAFYDPRCPFSHAAFKALDGEIEVRWLPTLALGEGGAPHNAYTLGEMNVEQNEAGEIVAASLVEDENRDDRLRSIMNGEQPPADAGEMTTAQLFTVDDNMNTMMRFFGPQTSLVGVPAFIVGRPDGTAAFVRGYDDQTVSIIEQIMNGDA